MGESTLRWPTDKEREEKEEVCSIGDRLHAWRTEDTFSSWQMQFVGSVSANIVHLWKTKKLRFAIKIVRIADIDDGVGLGTAALTSYSRCKMEWRPFPQESAGSWRNNEVQWMFSALVGDRKGIQPQKNLHEKPSWNCVLYLHCSPFPAVPFSCLRRTWRDGVKDDVKCLGLSREDAQVRNKWKWRVEEATG